MSNKFVLSAKIAFWKARARSAYISHENIVSGMSCGRHLADHVAAGSLAPLKRKFNNAMDRLKQLDSTAPSTRL